MFDRFWQQYPQGSVLSELLQIHGETYVVRVTIKSADQTLVSTLAAADQLAVAEAQAHQQALEILGCVGNLESAVMSTATLVEPEIVLGVVNDEPTAPPETPIPTPLPSEMPPIEVKSEPVAAPLSQPETLTPPDLQDEEPAIAIEPPTAPLVSEELPLPLPTTPAKSRTKKASAPEPEMPIAPEPEPAPVIGDEVPLTVTDMIPLINMELKRLNWTKEQGRDYMVTLYNKRASALLSDEELFGLLQHLKAEPVAVG
jgi:hypothetical protein